MTHVTRLAFAFPALLCLLLLVGGCEAQPARLNLAPPAASLGASDKSNNVAPQTEVAPGALRVMFQPLQDRRLDSESLGRSGGRVFSAEHIGPWVERALAGLASAQIHVVPAAEADAASVALTVTPFLQKTYVDNVSVTKSAVVVLELHYATTATGGPVVRRIYRGQHASMNWWNSEAELTAALQLAIKDCMAKIRADLDARARATLAPR